MKLLACELKGLSSDPPSTHVKSQVRQHTVIRQCLAAAERLSDPGVWLFSVAKTLSLGFSKTESY